MNMKDKLLRIRDLMAKYLDKIDISVRDKKMMQFRWLDKRTLDETGFKWGITKERVRQIEEAVISKIKEL